MRYSKVNSALYIIAVSALTAFYMLPAVKIGFDYTKLAIILFAFYAVFILKTEKLRPIITIVGNLLPYMFISFIVAKSGNLKLGFFHPLLVTWCMIFPAILCKDIIDRGNRKEFLSITIVMLSMLDYVMYNTIGDLAETPDIMRQLTAMSTMDEELRLAYAAENIGGFGIAYGTGAVVVLLITLVFNEKLRGWPKIVIYLLLGYALYFVLNAQFATLLFLVMFGSIASLYFSEYGRRHKIQLVSIGLLLLFFIPMLFQLLANLYEGTTIGEKLILFNESIFGEGNVTEVSGQRSKNQLDAFLLFLRSPIWGSDVTHDMFNATIYVSSHSTVLGVACSTGLIGLISYYKTYWSFIKPIYKDYASSGKQYVALVVYFFCFSFFNPSETTEACWIMFMIVPLLYNAVKIVNRNK